MKSNNLVFHDIKISFKNLNSLPTNSNDLENNHSENIVVLNDDSKENNLDQEETELKEQDYETFVFNHNKNLVDEEELKKILEVKLDGGIVNEYNTSFLATMCFPSLFPDTFGDLTHKNRKLEVFYKYSISHLLNIAFENENKELYFPFVEHPTFIFWAYNLLERKRILSQVRFFLSSDEKYNNLDKDKLSEILNDSLKYKKFLNSCMFYISVIRRIFPY